MWRPLSWENGQQILRKVLFSPSRDPTEGTVKIGVVNILASMLSRIHIHSGREVHESVQITFFAIRCHVSPCAKILLRRLVALNGVPCGRQKQELLKNDITSCFRFALNRKGAHNQLKIIPQAALADRVLVSLKGPMVGLPRADDSQTSPYAVLGEWYPQKHKVQATEKRNLCIPFEMGATLCKQTIPDTPGASRAPKALPKALPGAFPEPPDAHIASK